MSKVTGDREAVFAQAALKKGLVSREQAQECLSIARQLQQRGKPVAIEAVFVRKGYLRKAEASALLKKIRPSGGAEAAPKLALRDERPKQRGARCPSCKKDPGEDEDCYHCGADLATGGPGPRATVCESCSGVVLRGSAICFHCGQTISRRRRRREGRSAGGKLVDRLILLVTVVGMGYFLVYKNLTAAPKQSATPEAPAPDGQSTEQVLDEASKLAAAGKRDDAVKLLDDRLAALGESGPEADEKLRLQRALALIAPLERARRAANAVLARGDDLRILRRLARLAWEAGDAARTRDELKRIGSKTRTDDDWRLLARAEVELKGDWATPLAEVEQLQPAEAKQLALALWERGRAELAAGRLEPATKALERAAALAPRVAGLRASLGTARLRAGAHADARAAFQEAIKLDPRPASPYLGLGLALEGLNERKLAKKALEEFCRLARAEGGQAARVAEVEAKLKTLGD
ncbi:MAG: tetratricopeptide repeat protein [Planctomycetota bacterium]